MGQTGTHTRHQDIGLPIQQNKPHLHLYNQLASFVHTAFAPNTSDYTYTSSKAFGPKRQPLFLKKYFILQSHIAKNIRGDRSIRKYKY